MASNTGPVRSETQTKQGTGPQIMIFVLLFSLLLAIVVGGVLFSNTDQIDRPIQGVPSQQPANPTPSTGSG